MTDELGLGESRCEHKNTMPWPHWKCTDCSADLGPMFDNPPLSEAEMKRAKELRGLGESREPLPIDEELKAISACPICFIFASRIASKMLQSQLPSVPAEIESQPQETGKPAFRVVERSGHRICHCGAWNTLDKRHCYMCHQPLLDDGKHFMTASDHQLEANRFINQRYDHIVAQMSGNGKVEELARQLAEKDIPHRPKCSPEKCHCSGRVIAVRTAYKHGAEAYAAFCTQEKPSK